MHASEQAAQETRFFNERTNTDGNTFDLDERSIRIRNSEEVMDFVSCRREDGVTSYYYEDEFTKTQIVIHFTAGYLRGDLSALTQTDYHVSTAFLIPRNGKILNLFPWEKWSYHLGSGAVGGNTAGGKRTVGIELSNIGYLRKKGDHLITYASGDNDVYCSLSETQYYTKLNTPFREYEYYASFTDEQYESLIKVLRFLTSQFDIPREFLPEDQRYVVGNENDLPNFGGITSHVNYRSSGKWDFGPAFDWNRVIAGVQS